MSDCTFIIFGITGDLARRSLIPALYNLLKKEKIENFVIIGTGLEAKNLDEIFESIKKFVTDFDDVVWQKLISLTTYFQIDISKKDDFEKLKQLVLSQESKYKLSANRLVYCAVPSKFYADITKNLVNYKIIIRENKDKTWNRVAYEKPFGFDLKSAKELNKEILNLIDESQIFRVDHYIVKAIVETISFIRFTNRIFEPLWNNYHIDSVQIILDEEICLEGRGDYYDKYGALKDVVQNHMLQLMTLVAMEPPQKLTGDFIRDAKAHILQAIVPIDGILGQYEGYKSEPGVDNNSKTETFAALRLMINNPRWAEVPFYLKTGKCLDKKNTKIVIQFKHAYCLLEQNCPLEPNYLTIAIYPKEGIEIELNVKKPFVKNEIIKAKMDFCYDCLFGPGSSQTYEEIFLDIIEGEKAISIRQDEIEYSWQIIDKIIAMKFPLFKYSKGTNGPKELKSFNNKYNLEWK